MNTTTISGAKVQYLNGKLEYQCRVGALLKFSVWYRELKGANYEIIWTETREEARDLALGMRLHLLNNPVHPEFDKSPLAAGWSPSDAKAADDWRKDILATQAIARKFCHAAE